MSEDERLNTSFSTQFEFEAAPLPPEDVAIGAPFSPLPKSFYRTPKRLDICQDLATKDYIDKIIEIRRPFNIGDYQVPYVNDVARAFRLIKGKKNYLEVGIFDRGNLAYLSSIMAENAHLIGLDIVEEPIRDDLLRKSLKPNQRYTSVIGSSRSPETISQVRKLLAGEKLDGIFIDGDHTAYGAMSDYALYESFIADDGVILFHDSVWEGNQNYKGVTDALAEIDKLDPVYLIDGQNPVRRFLRPMWRNTFWGVVGVVLASDQSWRK